MENIEIKEKALVAEKIRIANVIAKKERLEKEYNEELKKWKERENTYFHRLNSMSISIDSGYDYIQRTEEFLKKKINN